jgi:hypothetical protein
MQAAFSTLFSIEIAAGVFVICFGRKLRKIHYPDTAMTVELLIDQKLTIEANFR